MPKRSMTFRTLGLLTSAEQAEAIEGDLIEEHPKSGRLRHIFRVLRIVLALAVGSVRSAPFRVALLCFASLVAIVLASSIVLTVVQATAVYVWPGPWHLPWHLPAIMLLSFLCGMRLAHIGRELGVSAACLAFAVVTGTTAVIGVLLFAQWLLEFRATGHDVDYRVLISLRFFLYPLGGATAFVSGPLLLGSIVQRQRALSLAAMLEQSVKA